MWRLQFYQIDPHILELRWPVYSAERNQLDNFCRGPYEEHSKVQIRIVCAPKIAFYFLTYQFKHVLDAQKNRLIEYPQHIFWLRNKKNNFPVHTLIWRPEHLCDIVFEF